MRFISGWVLIGLGIGQSILYKVFAELVHASDREAGRERKERRRIKRDVADEIRDAELEIEK